MFKIYTKTGDKGATSLIGGTRVPKSHIRIESYGTVDELNSYLGMVSDMATNEKITLWIREIQDRLFTIGTELATDPNKNVTMKLPKLEPEDIDWLEHNIDEIESTLPELRSFILPGGNLASSTCHVARCICRRAERICVQMLEAGENVEPLVIKYLNRLSDFLFVLCRYISSVNRSEEVLWHSRI